MARLGQRASPAAARPSREKVLLGLFVPITAVSLETERVFELVTFIVRGLFMHHWRKALDPNWIVDVQTLNPETEAQYISKWAGLMAGKGYPLKGDAGRGTFTYESLRSGTLFNFSLWQLKLFGGLEMAGVPNKPGIRLSRIFAVTRPSGGGLHRA